MLGDRISKQQNTDSSFSLFVKEDQSRMPKQYFFYKDINGLFVNETIETINPLWNADYAKVHFSYKPTNDLPQNAGDLVVFGELTNYGKDPEAKLVYNPQKGVYETDLFLKQGYYDYQYAVKEIQSGSVRFNSSTTEQNAWETENVYLILVYFRPLGGRYDELVSVRQVSSQFNRGLR